MASQVQVHASTTGIGMIDSDNCKINAVGIVLGVEYMPKLVLISTHISRAYFLGRVAKVGDSFLGIFPWGSLAWSAPTSEPTWALCINSNLLLVSVTIEVDNSPRPESWKTGVTDSSPAGVMVDLHNTADVLSFVAITTCVRLEPS